MNKIKLSELTDEEKIRMHLVKQAGFALNEIPLVLRFVKGDDSALEELQEFKEWKENKRIEESFTPFQPKG